MTAKHEAKAIQDQITRKAQWLSTLLPFMCISAVQTSLIL